MSELTRRHPFQMKDPFIPVMENEHKTWLADITIWLNEIKQWQDDDQKALETLKKMEQTIKTHSQALMEHTKAIEYHKSKIDDHIEAIADYQPTYAPEHEAELMVMHEQQATNHLTQRDIHERMKKRHCQTITRLSVIDDLLK